MKKISALKNFALVAFVSILGVSCSDDDESTPPPTVAPLKNITEIASGNADLSTLVAALKKAGLDEALKSGTYTVFAPTNKAFTDAYGASFPSAATYSKEEVAQILLNHVLTVKKNAKDLVTGYVTTEAAGITGTKLSMYVVNNAGKVTLNDGAEVTTADIPASNGVIHIVDEVITAPTIVEAALANPSFKTLVSVLNDPEQAATLEVLEDATTTAPLTVLAPTDAAFAVALDGWAKGASQATLTTVLQYHVVSGNNPSSGLMDAQEITTVGGQKVKVVKIASPLSVKFEDKAGDRATVQVADVQCANGIIHAISGVLQPTFPVEK